MRQEKISIVDEIRQWVKSKPFMIIVDYGGMKVEEFAELRNRLVAVDAEFHVSKNSFVRKAIEAEELPKLDEILQGPTAVCYGTDISGAAKILKNFFAEFEKPEMRGGILDGKVLTTEELKQLANLPAREVLLAKLVGLINTPATTLARLIGTPGTQVAQVIKAKSEKGE